MGIFEGLDFNPFIYAVGHYDEMQEIVDAGYAEIVNKEKELLVKLDAENMTSKIEKFWKSNSLKNMKCEIDRIINNER